MRKYRWSHKAPNAHERTLMYKRCGKKCFLGTHKSFPVCAKHTCKINAKGIHSAFVRAKSLKAKTKSRKYDKIIAKSKKMLKRYRL